LNAFLTLFVVIDPIGLAPVFVSLTSSHSATERKQIAQRAVLMAGGILLVFTLGGTLLLRYLGISIAAFQTAAGILLFKIAVDMVFVQRERETAEEEKEALSRQDISVFPLAIPLIAGPGTLASILILVNRSQACPWSLSLVLGTAGIVLLITYTLFRLSGRLAHLLGQTGINVVTRILGVLLAALAVQYIADGVVRLLALA